MSPEQDEVGPIGQLYVAVDSPAVSEESSDSSGVSEAVAPKTELLGMELTELTQFFVAHGFEKFRGEQIYIWLYRRGAVHFDEMTDLPKQLRAWLAEHAVIGYPEMVRVLESSDGSHKALFKLDDNRAIESVLMPEKDWKTLCLSSQVGCAVACSFCMTGFGGFRRQLRTAEIVAQVLAVKRYLNGGEFPRNLVFMGQGEPLNNLDNLIPALRLLTDPNGIGIGARRITVSTSGVVPGIRRLGEAGLGVNLAISLNGSNDEFRTQIMPINKRWPIAQLLNACRTFPMKSNRRITFEYVMLSGQNDSLREARELAELLKGLPAKVNLIPWNPDPRLPWKRPSDDRIEAFRNYLSDCRYTTTVRYSKALDVGGACGQLAGHYEHEQSQAGREFHL
jgi:23S rRNA (adenine2503-C2)-methyltransferase